MLEQMEKLKVSLMKVMNKIEQIQNLQKGDRKKAIQDLKQATDLPLTLQREYLHMRYS